MSPTRGSAAPTSYLTHTSTYQAALVALCQGFSVIPLKGKRPALRSWRRYQYRHPTENDLCRWFIDESHTSYGIICGEISRLVVLDLDDPDTAVQFAETFPELTKTYTVRSGLRKTPHIYWRADFPVKSRKVSGGDLKGEGGYVVGPGSQIAGGTWEIVKDVPIRTITPVKLNQVLVVLADNKPIPVTIDPEIQTTLNTGDFTTIYHSQVAATGQRNNTLFRIACLVRDHGHTIQQAIDMLAGIHAKESTHGQHSPETGQQRIAEACATVASAYTRPPRSRSEATVSRLPNNIREKVLQQPDGTATLRTLEGLRLKGLKPGDIFTHQQARELLGGTVGDYSIRKALKATYSGNHFFPPLHTPQQANADCLIDAEASAPPCRLSAGQNQHWVPYLFPSTEALCILLEVKPSGSDPITLEDVKSPKTYRMALEREFIKRRPGRYFQDLLAARLSVSDRTIRRYHAEIPIKSVPQYLETPVFWSNIGLIPTEGDIRRYGLHLGGQFLEDDSGKRWPLKQEIARMLLSEKRYVVHKIQVASFYYFGDLPPPEASYTPHTATGPPQQEQVRRILAEDEGQQPVPFAEIHAVAQREPATNPVKGRGIANNGKAMVQLPLLPGIEPYPVPSKNGRPSRQHAKPLADERLEQLANDIHTQVDRLSLYNARQLVDVYGPDLVKRTLSKMKWLAREGKLRSPAGFMVTAIRVAWKDEGEWGRGQSGFKSILPHRIEPKDDPLWQSEVYRKWRTDFGWDADHLTLPPIEEDLPY